MRQAWEATEVYHRRENPRKHRQIEDYFFGLVCISLAGVKKSNIDQLCLQAPVPAVCSSFCQSRCRTEARSLQRGSCRNFHRRTRHPMSTFAVPGGLAACGRARTCRPCQDSPWDLRGQSLKQESTQLGTVGSNCRENLNFHRRRYARAPAARILPYLQFSALTSRIFTGSTRSGSCFWKGRNPPRRRQLPRNLDPKDVSVRAAGLPDGCTQVCAPPASHQAGTPNLPTKIIPTKIA